MDLVLVAGKMVGWPLCPLANLEEWVLTSHHTHAQTKAQEGEEMVQSHLPRWLDSRGDHGVHPGGGGETERQYTKVIEFHSVFFLLFCADDGQASVPPSGVLLHGHISGHSRGKTRF